MSRSKAKNSGECDSAAPITLQEGIDSVPGGWRPHLCPHCREPLDDDRDQCLPCEVLILDLWR